MPNDENRVTGRLNHGLDAPLYAQQEGFFVVTLLASGFALCANGGRATAGGRKKESKAGQNHWPR